MRGRDAADAAAPSTGPPPRANPDLLGHAAAEAELRRLFDNGRLPHALLFGGPRGIGKATLAFRLARFVLAQGGKQKSGCSATARPLVWRYRPIAACFAGSPRAVMPIC
jgi:hypothetical protein